MSSFTTALLLAGTLLLLTGCGSPKEKSGALPPGFGAAGFTSSPRPSPTPPRGAVSPVVETPNRTTVPAPAVRYVALGASDSVGIGSSDPNHGSWPALLAAKLPTGSSYTNLAVSGSTVANATKEQLPQTAALDPQLITIWLAVNDLNAQVTPATYGAQLRALTAALLRQGRAQIYVANIPDLRLVPVYAHAPPDALSVQVDAFNREINSAIALDPTRVHLVDLYVDSRTLLTDLVVSADGFHPNDNGYRIIADHFLTAIRKTSKLIP